MLGTVLLSGQRPRVRLSTHPGFSKHRYLLGGILAVGALLRCWLLARGVPTLSSDEAVTGLMALHFLHGQPAIYFWGQHYMGSLESLTAAPFILLLGTTPLALRLAPLLFSLASIATVYLLGARIYTTRVGLVAALLLALGPVFYVLVTLRALGGYPETAFFGNVLLLLALHEALPQRRTSRHIALIGLLAGLALWTDLLVVPYIVALLAVFLMQRRADLLRWPHGFALVGGTLLGMLPAIAYSLTHGFSTVTQLLSLATVGSNGSSALGTVVWQHVTWFVTVSLPIFTGSALGGTQVAGYLPTDYAHAATHAPVYYGWSLLVVALSVAALGVAACALARRRRAVSRGSEGSEGGLGAVARGICLSASQQGQVALLLVCLVTGMAFLLSKEPYIYAIPRYLLPLSSAIVLVVGGGAQAIAAARSRWPRHATLSTAVAWAALLAVVLSNLAGNLVVTPKDTAALDHTTWIYGNDASLIALLHAHAVRTVISNDYWEGLRLTYETHERVLTVMVTPQGHPGLNRYAPYVKQGLADPRPGYVELTGTVEAHLDLRRLHAGALPGYQRVEVGPYTVLVPPRPGSVRTGSARTLHQ